MTEPSKKALMKKGTKWRTIKEIDIYILVENPEYKGAKARAYDIRDVTEHELTKGIVSRLSKKLVTIPANTLLTVDGKSSQDWGAEGKLTMGTLLPFTFPKEGCVLHRPGKITTWAGFPESSYVDEISPGVLMAFLPYKEIDKFVVLDEPVGEQFNYVIRDSATGLFYKTTTYPYFQQRWEYDHQSGRNIKNPNYEEGKPKPGVDPYVMVDKVSKAKQHTDLGKVKTTILNFIGYFNGMPDNPDMPEWCQGDQREGADAYPFLPTLEAVKMEKFSKNIVEVIDLQQWYERTMKLRVLTKAYGGTVRTLYNKVDKAGELSKWQYIVSFRVEGDNNQLWNVSVKQAEEIDAAIQQLGLSKGCKKAKDSFGVSVAVDTLGAAMTLKMASDSLKSAILDLHTLTEMVG